MSIEKATSPEDEEFEIEIVDDTPEQDRGKSKRPADAAPDVPEDDEIASYSDNVQKRIKTINEIAQEYGVHPTHVSQWKKELLDNVGSLFEGKRGPKPVNAQNDPDRLYAKPVLSRSKG